MDWWQCRSDESSYQGDTDEPQHSLRLALPESGTLCAFAYPQRESTIRSAVFRIHGYQVGKNVDTHKAIDSNRFFRSAEDSSTGVIQISITQTWHQSEKLKHLLVE